jgi:hypothetical protein
MLDRSKGFLSKYSSFFYPCKKYMRNSTKKLNDFSPEKLKLHYKLVWWHQIIILNFTIIKTPQTAVMQMFSISLKIKYK